jgi:hypothetical protein
MGDWSQGFQGAAGGAAAGAAFGPWGAAVGGVIGGAAGLLGDDSASSYQDQLKQMQQQFANMSAAQMGPAAQAQYSQFRQNQAGLISQLEAAANGTGPSAAALQMRQAMDQAAGAQASAAAGAGGRGVNAGAAQRLAMNNTAAIQSKGAADTAIIRAQEQLNARGQLGNAIAQGRSADEGVNEFNAGAQNQNAQANMMAKMQALGISTPAQLQALQLAMQAAGPGMGTQLLAGGASAIPGMLAYKNAQNQQQQQQIAQQSGRQDQFWGGYGAQQGGDDSWMGPGWSGNGDGGYGNDSGYGGGM